MLLERYVIHVTKECNCDCLYCYEDDKTSVYDWNEIKTLIDNIVKHRTNNEFNIEFLGGEPLLCWNLIKQSYEYLESIPDVFVHNYGITTNGTILDEEIIDYLSKNKKISFAASVDGHLHANQFRVFKVNRKNTLDIVLSNLKLLRDKNISNSVHMVTHPYNVAMISDSIDFLYGQGVRSLGIGTIEKTMKIDNEYCDRFVNELDKVSGMIIGGIYPGLIIDLFEWVKPHEDVRSYIRDKFGKTIAESYGRSGKDITHADKYNVTRCSDKNDISEMIYHIRKTVYNNHQKRLKGLVEIDY